MKLLVILFQDNKESTASCLITKFKVIILIFIFLFFHSLFSQPISVICCLSMLPFEISQNLKYILMQSHYTIREAPCLVCSTRLSPGGQGDQIQISHVLSFFHFFCFSSLSRGILQTAQPPALCNVFSSIYQLFVLILLPCTYLCVFTCNTE